MSTVTDPEICFVIPAGSGEQLYLEKCVQSALHAARLSDKHCDILVVFDGPASAVTKAQVTDAGARFLLISEKGGPAAARNRGVSSTTAPILFFVDADVVLDKYAVQHAFKGLEEQGYDGVIGAYTPHTPAPGVVSQLKNLQHSHVHRSHPGPVRSFWTACAAIRRDAYLSVGGLDEYQRYCEDIALGIKLMRADKRILLNPDISCTHMKRYTLSSWIHSDLVGRAIPWSKMILTGRAEMGQLNTDKRGIASLLAALTLVASPLLCLWPTVAIGLFFAGLLVLILVNRGFISFVNQHASWPVKLAVIPFLILYSVLASLGFGVAFITTRLNPGFPT